VACLGLLKAIERFDPARGFAFPSFAVPTILGELRRSFRATAWAAHVPRDLQERAIRVRREADAWVGRHGRTPTIGELAEAGGWVHEEVVDALAAAQTLAPASLDARITGHHDGDGPALLDRLGDDDPDLDLVERRDTIASALNGLSDIQREVIRLRFDEELTQSQIAARVGFSQMHVSRVLRAALERLNLVT
jgi:RNA polymerase sigma-B factor